MQLIEGQVCISVFYIYIYIYIYILEVGID